MLRDLNDPRIKGMITVSAVRVSRDLSSALVYFTLLQESDLQAVTDGLQNAAGFLGVQLGKSLSLKKMPRLQFCYDKTLDEGEKIDRLLNPGKAGDALLKDDN